MNEREQRVCLLCRGGMGASEHAYLRVRLARVGIARRRLPRDGRASGTDAHHDARL